MTLRTRLFLLVGTAVAATVALVTWVVSLNARGAFEAFDRQRTAALMAEFRREFTRQGEDVEQRVDRIVASDAFQRLVAEIGRRPSDFGPFVNEAAALASAQGLEFLDLVADDGTLISSAEWPARFGYRHPWAAGASKSGAAFLHAVELPRETALGLMAVRRIGVNGRSIHLAGGRRLDRQFLKSLPLPAGMRALLYRNVEPEVSGQQLIDVNGLAPQPGPLAPIIARVRDSGRDLTEVIKWPDGPEAVDAIPLTGAQGPVLGVLILGSSNRELASLLSKIRWTGLGVGAAGVALGLTLAFVLAARVTRPLEQLAGAAGEIAAGRWDVRTEAVGGPAEIGALAGAFDAMARQLVDQRERLVQAERVAAWRELARRLAHELKNPLFPLRLTVDNLRRAKPLPPAEFDEVFEESVGTINTGLANLNTVIARFSDFAKMPAPEFASISPDAIVEDAVRLFRAQLDSHRVRVVLDLDGSGARVRADAEQVGRVIQNLILNAVDAMPGGGELIVRTRRADARFTIQVGDSGEGMDAEEAQRLFTPYYTTKQHGTGLGLAIVQSVVADHRGRVWVESARGRGTTVHVSLPLEGEEPRP